MLVYDFLLLTLSGYLDLTIPDGAASSSLTTSRFALCGEVAFLGNPCLYSSGGKKYKMVLVELFYDLVRARSVDSFMLGVLSVSINELLFSSYSNG